MDKILNYQISLFGNFFDIKADNETANKFLNTFTGYNVGSILLTIPNFRTGQLINEKRLQLISPQKNILITFLPERIDLNYQWNPLFLRNNIGIEEVFSSLSSELEKLKNLLPTTIGNRLATSCNVLTKKLTLEQLNSKIEYFSKRNLFYSNEEKLTEWIVRFNSRDKYSINKTQEVINRVITLSLPQNMEFENQIEISIDINSEAEKADERFSIKNLIDFSKDKKNIIVNYINKVDNEINA